MEYKIIIKIPDSLISQTDNIANMSEYASRVVQESLERNAEEEYDGIDEQAFDEAARSPEVRQEILKMNEILRRKNL